MEQSNPSCKRYQYFHQSSRSFRDANENEGSTFTSTKRKVERYVIQGQRTGDSNNSSTINCKLPSMPVSRNSATAGSIDGCSKEWHVGNRRSHDYTGYDRVCSKRQQHKRRKGSKMTLMHTSMLSLVFATAMTMCMLNIAPVEAFGLSSTQFTKLGMRSSTRSILRNNNKATSLLLLAQSEKSTDSLPTSNANTNTNTNINPAATPQTSSSTNEYSFFDEAIIYIRAGSGGQGSSTYRKGVNNQNGPPDGGNGGKGGDVILKVDESLNTLAGLARYAWRPNSFGGGGGARRRNSENDASTSVRVLSFKAENGIDGKRQNKAGGNGKDVIVRVPPGTIVQEEVAPDSTEDDGDGSALEPTYISVGTVTKSNPILLAANGGAGGEGSAAQKHQRGVRQTRIPPQGGQRMRLKLTLKVIADVALVAIPSAGKSTLLAAVTRAKPKIADYPFTTVVPNLGVWVPSSDLAYGNNNSGGDYDDSLDEAGNSKSTSLILCDVPGLIAGASEGIGLGHAFLRHVERCHVILHLLDATSKDVLDEYAMINKELLNYGTGKLATMPQVVVVNKLDVAFVDDENKTGIFSSKEELEEELKKVMPHSRLMWMSAKEGDGVDDLMERVAMFVNKVKEASAAEERRKAIKVEED